MVLNKIKKSGYTLVPNKSVVIRYQEILGRLMVETNIWNVDESGKQVFNFSPDIYKNTVIYIIRDKNCYCNCVSKFKANLLIVDYAYSDAIENKINQYDVEQYNFEKTTLDSILDELWCCISNN
ncbi:hypothetical protein [Mycoplasma sp. P36-A1]|uniref:hypothetical protein n=1 Tax=Mycoplasma sp. P36-A1 TaxID=3252900 RepID=UPI003C2C2BB0